MEFSKPEQVLEQVPGLGPGSVVVDLGCGSGHYSAALCRMNKGEGRVYAVDVQKDLLDRLKRAIESEGHSNFEVVWGDIDQYGGSKLRTESADVVLLCNVLFQLEDRTQALNEASRLVRPGGRLVIVDWTDSHFGLGPDDSLVITATAARELCASAPYLEEEKELQAGAHHWGIVFRKKA